VSIILRKENRKAIISKSYKVVSLLNYMRKVVEKIIATRLSYIAKTTNLLKID
jgi:hypothetical protein